MRSASVATVVGATSSDGFLVRRESRTLQIHIAVFFTFLPCWTLMVFAPGRLAYRVRSIVIITNQLSLLLLLRDSETSKDNNAFGDDRRLLGLPLSVIDHL